MASRARFSVLWTAKAEAQLAEAQLAEAWAAATDRASVASAANGLDIAPDNHLEDLIVRRLTLPVEKRMNFLRRRLPGGGSCL